MPKIKICGLCRPCDVDFVNEACPDYIGFVFAESRRRVTAEEAARLRGGLRADIVPAGVFVNEKVEVVARLYMDGIIQTVQLHGDEDDGYIRELRGIADIPVIKSFRVRTEKDVFRAQSSPADYILYDGGAGTGGKFDWRFLKNQTRPFFMAGGINGQNIKEALSFSPFCIDVSSGAESGGRKDREKILKLVREVRDHEEGIK